MRHDQAKIDWAGQHDWSPFKNYFEPWYENEWLVLIIALISEDNMESELTFAFPAKTCRAISLYYVVFVFGKNVSN